MAKVEIFTEVKVACIMEADSSKPGTRPALKRTDFALDLSENMQRAVYLTDEDVPTDIGFRAICSTLIQGLVGVIAAMHQNGYRDKDEHIEYILNEINRSLAAAGPTFPSEFQHKSNSSYQGQPNISGAYFDSDSEMFTKDKEFFILTCKQSRFDNNNFKICSLPFKTKAMENKPYVFEDLLKELQRTDLEFVSIVQNWHGDDRYIFNFDFSK